MTPAIRTPTAPRVEPAPHLLPTEAPVDVVIVGGGFTGLAAALELASKGFGVRVLEAESEAGGLAASFDVGGRALERFYHHWFSSDTDILGLCEELGIADAVEPHLTRTGMYYANTIFKLSKPVDILRFSPLAFTDRIRLGLLALRAGRVRNWRELEHRTAEEWLISLGGRRVYEVVWRPLLEGKFGPYAGQIGATWMWTKLHLRGGSRTKSGSETLYYLRGGSKTLVTALVERLTELGVDLRTDSAARALHIDERGLSAVEAGGRLHPARQVLVTTAPEQAARLLDGPHAAHPAVPALNRQLRQVRYLANVCLVLENNRRLSDTYWLNVNDPAFPYVGVIEHTNMDDPARYGGRHVVYLSKYLPADADLYLMSDHQVFEYSLPYLRQMFPGFDRSWVHAYHVWRAEYAQPVVTPGYTRTMPPLRTEVPGLYLAGMAQVFPEDRGTNYAVRGGRQAARLMAEHLDRARRQRPDQEWEWEGASVASDTEQHREERGGDHD
ncbi:NAD(P)/FAD-dependent oxidoreductase [Streptomyces sp. BE20]|uniref:NAD(P)/FAD-dependent oxidoreductase n=1 Tax=unclassified Streptomyces TaxID=2593676 RepID=UPI002E767415|nr:MULTISPECIES: NAD(P)/FAD-dependent oxidoreductase [unclassified Streptomyces]MED7950207.1 NAD(P)/FAD-dependent oxidoreductase [Streptomyces sp. BE303]MEE1822166.1 NAD(P)/FAD-dependent oxidoreductase [Streptomyces sp. BE20]